ncbi:dTDP-glucose 4,6-dehydratase [Aneurinibacillus migulanus]|uniref:dTDP-glucose 4,6-dehydratase n=1 Tax=Aneurinibacillus migulanus TaxID=47500 RepID=UPI002E22BDB7|nr:dTDP-glucose 4,6-dehydratase [Aneurinibacillus migulanus]
MIYLVTGGAGFIGANFIHYMFNKFHDEIQIINVDKLTYAANLPNLESISSALIEKSCYIFEQIDICDSENIERIFRTYKPDYVINFAAETHVDRSIISPQIFLKTNVLGTQVLLDASLKYGVRRFHQISTDEVYGSIEEGYFTEQTPLNPRSPYSASKASADLLCQAYYSTYQLPITISRCSNNYGPYQYVEKLIPLVITRLLRKESIPVYGDGLNVRDWLHVRDHCDAIEKIIHRGKDGEVYNIGGNNEWKNIDLIYFLIKKIKSVLAKSTQEEYIYNKLITYVEDRKGHDRRYAIDVSKIREELHWEAKVFFEEGIQETVTWYLQKEK